MTTHYIPREKNITNFAITLRRAKKNTTLNIRRLIVLRNKKTRLLKQLISARTDIHEKLQDCLKDR